MSSSGKHYSYDEVPYPDLCYPETHPSRLVMLGKLLGMSPAPAEKCRVLEIGCATGWNLVPMASLLPESIFVGIDLSAVQIQKAAAVVAALGLTNLTVQQMDIMDIQPDFGQFDYIIAHGIYSWVPPAVRDKLIAVCKQNLAPQGIAYVSYNTYPGWHTMDIIRNMMLYRSRNAETPMEKSAQAREWITFMAEALAQRENSAYAAVFEDYLGFRITQADEFDHGALLHDEMEANNAPVYFHEFAAHAEQHGLQYLVESNFQTVLPNGLTNEVIQHLRETATTTIEMEQYFDYLRNRSFRRTLLCHDEVEVDRGLGIEAVRTFYISSVTEPAAVDAALAARGVERFEAKDGNLFATDHPLTKGAFHYLSEVSPIRVGFDALVATVGGRIGTPQPEAQDADILAGNLLRAFSHSADLVDFHGFAPPIVAQVSDHPLTTAYLRFQAHQGSTVFNLLHKRVELDNLSRFILMNLDGHNDRQALVEFLVKLADEGVIIQAAGEGLEVGSAARTTLMREVEQTLQILADRALLVA